jgi:thiol-disulfide isomerase/thioredoxin
MSESEKHVTPSEQSDKPHIVRKLFKLLVYALVFVLAMQLGQLWVQRDVVIGEAPPIEAIDINGQPVSLQDYHGKPLLVYFWATWCPICRLEHDAISSLAEDYAVVSIALQSGSATEVASHMKEYEAVYRVINDPDGELGARYGIRGVPTSFILDSNGNIRSTLSGFTTGLSLRLRMWLLMPDNDSA